MTTPQTHPVTDADAHQQAVAEYRRAGYAVARDTDGETVLKRGHYGTLVSHLVLFFTIGWLTLGLLNLWYAYRTRRKTAERVRVVTR